MEKTIDLIPLREFYHPNVQQIKKVNSDQIVVEKPKNQPKIEKTNKSSSENIVMSAYEYSSHDSTLYLGLSNGEIYYYKTKNIDQKNIFAKGKDPDLQLLDSPNPHKGEIRKMIYTPVNEGQLEILISASADRTLKLWDPKNVKGNACFQTLVGHDGSVLDMIYISKVDQLITSSTDKSIRIWVIDKQRSIFQYPWFVISYKIQDFKSLTRQNEPIDIWINCIELNDTEKLGFYAGDSEGSLYKFNAIDGWRDKCEFQYEKKFKNVHRSGIQQILDVQKISCSFSIGYDQTVRGFNTQQNDSLNKDSYIFEMENKYKVCFTCMCWDLEENFLYLGDELGYVYIANIYMGKEYTTEKKLCEGKIKKINIFQTGNKQFVLLCFTERGMYSFQIVTGYQSQDIEGHSDSILKIISLDPKKIEKKTLNKSIKDKPKIITCSLDNTIRLWDSKKMDAVLNVVESPKNSEISCMTFLYNSCLVATGHEDGVIRLWNLEISSQVTLKSQKGGSHSNSISCIIGEIINDEEYLIAGSYDGTISVWEISQKVSGGKEGSNSTQSTTIFPQFSHSIDNSKYNQLDYLEGHEILCMHLFKDERGAHLIVGGNSKKIQVYDLKTGDYQVTMLGHEDSVTSIAEDGIYIFTGSDDCNILFWNTREWYSSHHSKGIDQIRIITPVRDEPLKGHTESIQDICVLPNGILLSCSYDKRIIAWSYQQPSGQNFIMQFKKKEELRCMDYIDTEKQKKLFIGTNRGVILTEDLTELLKMNNTIGDFALSGTDYFENIDINKMKQLKYDSGEEYKQTEKTGEKDKQRDSPEKFSSELQKIFEDNKKLNQK